MKFTDAQIAEALRKNAGNATAAAHALGGITRQAIDYRVKKSAELQAVADDASETVTDVAEGQLIKAIKKGQAWAVKFWLTTRGRDRGFVTRTEQTGKNGGPIQHVPLDPALLKGMSDDDLSRLEAICARLAGGTGGDPEGDPGGES